MSDEIKLELKKPLDKMTAKELRELCKSQLPQIVGVSGMEKEEIVTSVKQLLGMNDEDKKGVSPYKAQIHSIKSTIRGLRTAKTEMAAAEGTRKSKEILRRKINKLKKRTRRLAAV